MWELEAYASNCKTSCRSKDENKAIETLQRTATFEGERYEVGMLWNDNPKQLPNNFLSAMGQLTSLETKIRKRPTG